MIMSITGLWIKRNLSKIKTGSINLGEFNLIFTITNKMPAISKQIVV